MSTVKNLMSTTSKKPFGEKTVTIRPMVFAVMQALREIGQAADRDRYRKTLQQRVYSSTEVKE